MAKLKIYHLLDNGHNYSDWIDREIVHSIEEADIVWANGGSDVSPSYYGHPVHKSAGNYPETDALEYKDLCRAMELGKKIVATCKGAQWCCVLAGGTLIQDQPNPRFYHKMITYDGKSIDVTSTHHQAQNPFNLPQDDYKILGWTNGVLDYHKDGYDKEVNPPVECEIVHYYKIKALAFQPHFEMMQKGSEGQEYAKELFYKFYNNEL